MTILVTGATGRIGSQIIERLAQSGASVRALTRTPEKARLPAGVTAVAGDLLDVDSTRAALQGVSTLFLLAANVPDELTQALTALNLARDAGVRGIVYLSVFKGEAYSDVPHFTGKHAVERMIADGKLPATVLRPAYFMQNDAMQKEALLGAGIYGASIGTVGIAMVDTRDIAEAAAAELLRRERSPVPLGPETYDLVGPENLTGPGLAALWAEVLGREVRHGGDDLDVTEQQLRGFAPGWLAYELRLMMRRYQEDGAVATPDEVERMTQLLGHPPRRYRDFAAETARAWRGA